ncbi:MAG: hypothetical protein ING33_07030, partial [Rhodocyclaceae bacterium]|nr:hypothetical protein [Rhodocyclaceae bacterium]
MAKLKLQKRKPLKLLLRPLLLLQPQLPQLPHQLTLLLPLLLLPLLLLPLLLLPLLLLPLL